ncbi:MAG TPA: DnaA/Hda family protein [Alphaproteobacteria bacterium]
MTNPKPPVTRQGAFAFDWPEAMEPDNFIVSQSNRLAYDYVTKPQDWPATCLLIQGPTASGKTHLAQIFTAVTGAAQLNAANLGQPHWQRHRAYVVDNVDQFIGQNLAHEEALFHLYNAAKSNNDRLLLLSTQYPGYLNFLLPDLKSRLLASPQATLDMPDESLLKTLYVKLFADRQLAVKPDVIEYIIKRTARSFDAVQNLVQQLDQWALATNKPITIPVVSKFLQDQEKPADENQS